MTNILLTATLTPSTIVSYVVGAIIIALAIYFIYTKYKKDPEGEAKLTAFLDGIQDIIKEHITEAINNFDFGNSKDSFGEVQAEFVEGIYNDIWDLCSTEVEKLADTDTVLYALLKKVITKDKIDDYVMTIMSEDSIQDKLADLYNAALKDKVDQITEEDKALEKEAEAYENGEVETKTVPELDPTKLPGVEDEPIIPPVEEESESVSSSDPTVEVIPTESINLESKVEPEE